MSEQQQLQDPAQRIASARDVAGYFRDDCRTLRDSLQLEMVVAQYLLQMRDVRSPQGVPVGDATSAAVIDRLERHGDRLSHAILRGLAHLATGDAATRSADAVARLGERDVGLPRKFADVGEARATGAWRNTKGAHPGEFVLFLDFEHPQGRGHSLGLFVEPRHGGVVKHIGLMSPMSELDSDHGVHPSELEAIEIPEAATLLRELLDRSYGPCLRGTDDYRVLIAAARARAMEKAPLAVER
jgi:hypothetical protein